MKKIFTPFSFLIILLAACSKEQIDSPVVETATNMAPQVTRRCASQEVYEQQIAADPALRNRMVELEEFTRKFQADPANSKMINGVITIPVVMHVLYNSAAENLSLAQLQSQIDVLNEDFNNTNADRFNVPTEFQPVQATVGIRFVLDSVRRKYTTKLSWTSNDDVKKTTKGGDNPISVASKLNIWTCNLSGGILGYAQFPGGSTATDGVVLLYSAVGRTGTLIANYNLGRTATHEIGHWLNLKHIWGDATCGTDLVTDTPPASTYNSGCPSYPKYSTCTGNKAEMTMNYMDYTNDACMYMFTNGQKSRINAMFVSKAPRAGFALP